MRWLILILLISCGKHEEPKALDLRDADGDQILNANESVSNKYIANVEAIGQLKGRLRFQHAEVIEVDFSNQAIIASEIITGSEKKPEETKFFSEGSKIVLARETKLEFKSMNYKVQMQFFEGSSNPDEIYFSDGKRQFLLGAWKQDIVFDLAASDLKLIMEGKAHLLLSKKYAQKTNAFNHNEAETVQEKTYRVFYQDGDKNRILYVSKELGFEQLLSEMNITSASEITEDELFFSSKEISSKVWFYRNFKNGDKALVKSEFQSLTEIFKKRFIITKQLVTRENGRVITNFKINNPTLSSVYLRIRPSKVMRSFRNTQEERRYSEGGGGGREGNGRSWEYCTHYLTHFQNDKPTAPSMTEVIDELGINLPEFSFQEESDEKGPYLNAKAAITLNEISLNLQNSPATSFKTTGQTRASCDSGSNRTLSPPVSTNVEAKFSLEIESYVEKIN